MSKRAKRERQRLRASGIEPKLDAKRRVQKEQFDARQARIAADERFRIENPEEWERQRREREAQGVRAINTVFNALAAIGGF